MVMVPIQVRIDRESRDKIKKLVSDGTYPNCSEVIRTAVGNLLKARGL